MPDVTAWLVSAGGHGACLHTTTRYVPATSDWRCCAPNDCDPLVSAMSAWTVDSRMGPSGTKGDVYKTNDPSRLAHAARSATDDALEGSGISLALGDHDPHEVEGPLDVGRSAPYDGLRTAARLTALFAKIEAPQ